MKKSFVSLMSIAFLGLTLGVVNGGKAITTYAASKEVLMSNIPVSTFASGNNTTVSYSNDGVRMLIQGADTSGSADAWRNYALIPNTSSSTTFSLANNDKDFVPTP